MAINIGIIGFGLSGSVFHAPTIHHLKSFNLLGIVTRNNERKKKLKINMEIYQFIILLKN